MCGSFWVLDPSPSEVTFTSRPWRHSSQHLCPLWGVARHRVGRTSGGSGPVATSGPLSGGAVRLREAFGAGEELV